MENKKFKFYRDGKEEEVDIERWVWVALYNDNSFLKQFDEETGFYHQFKEIDQSRLSVFIMQSVSDPAKRYELHFREGMKLIHYYRNVVLNAATPQEVRYRLYCFGFSEEGHKVIFQIYPNDMVAIGNDD